jgi:hypothetical protein
MKTKDTKHHKREESFLVKYSRVIEKISKETRKRNRPLSVRKLIKYLKKLPPKAVVELMITQQTKYRSEPSNFTGTMKNFGIGKFGSAKHKVTLIAEREN